MTIKETLKNKSLKYFWFKIGLLYDLFQILNM